MKEKEILGCYIDIRRDDKFVVTMFAAARRGGQGRGGVDGAVVAAEEERIELLGNLFGMLHTSLYVSFASIKRKKTDPSKEF